MSTVPPPREAAVSLGLWCLVLLGSGLGCLPVSCCWRRLWCFPLLAPLPVHPGHLMSALAHPTEAFTSARYKLIGLQTQRAPIQIRMIKKEFRDEEEALRCLLTMCRIWHSWGAGHEPVKVMAWTETLMPEQMWQARYSGAHRKPQSPRDLGKRIVNSRVTQAS